MISYFSGGSNESNVATFFNVWGGASSAGAETQASGVCSGAFTVDNLYVVVPTAPGAGTSFVYALRKNGGDTALTCTISGTATSANDTNAGHAVTFAAGDTICLAVTVTGSPANPLSVSWNMRVTATGFQPIPTGGQNSSPSVSATNYGPPFTSGIWAGGEASRRVVFPAAGTIDQLYIKRGAAPGIAASGKSCAYTLYKNGSPTALTATISETATTANDTTHSVSVAAGDTISMESVPTATPAAGSVCFGFNFTPTVAGDFVWGGCASNAPSSSAVNYDAPIAGGQAWNSSETAGKRMLAPGAYIKAFYVELVNNPDGNATGAGYQITLRDNVTDTGPSVIMVGNTVDAHTFCSVLLANTDLLALQSTPIGSPTSTGAVMVGILLNASPLGVASVDVYDRQQAAKRSSTY